MLKNLPALILLLILAPACTKRVTVAHRPVGKEAVIEASADWVKNKGGKFDMLFKVRNVGASAVAIVTDDVKCARGGAPGVIVSTPFDQAKIVLQIKAGETKTWVLVCKADGQGDSEVLIRNVYRYDSASASQRSDLLAQNISFSVTPDGAVKGNDGASPQWASNMPASSSSGGSSKESGGDNSKESGGVMGFANDLFKTRSGTGVNTPPSTAQPTPSAQPKSSTEPPVATTEEHQKPMRSAVVADPSWVIAIMDVVDTNTGSQKALDKDLIRNLSDQLRVFVAQRGIRTVDRSAQDKAMTDQIRTMKSESYKTCYDDTCQIELGKALAASHILRSRITRFGSKCVLNAELIDLKAEVVIAAASSRGDCGDEGFLRMGEEVAQAVTGK